MAPVSEIIMQLFSETTPPSPHPLSGEGKGLVCLKQFLELMT